MGGGAEKLMNQIMELKCTSKSLQHQASKCEEEKSEKLKVKKAIKKGNMDGSLIYAKNSIRKHTEQMNHLCLASCLNTQAKKTMISKPMSNIVKSLYSSLTMENLQKMSETMDCTRCPRPDPPLL